jgi:hypothetical protein
LCEQFCKLSKLEQARIRVGWKIMFRERSQPIELRPVRLKEPEVSTQQFIAPCSDVEITGFRGATRGGLLACLARLVPSNENPLDLIERQLISAAVIKLGGAG